MCTSSICRTKHNISSHQSQKLTDIKETDNDISPRKIKLSRKKAGKTGAAVTQKHMQQMLPHLGK